MAAQIFISYRREGGDMAAKLICEALKNRGYSVFYDYDALKGGPFDTNLITAIQSCNDFVLVLPPHALDRCINNEQDWVRQEIYHALQNRKNIIPVMLNGFDFPETLPDDINEVRRYNGVRFLMDYFDAVIDKIIERLVSCPQKSNPCSDPKRFTGKLTVKRPTQFTGIVRNINIHIDGAKVGMVAAGGTVSFDLSSGTHTVKFTVDWMSADVSVEISPTHAEAVVEISFKTGFFNSLAARIIQ